MQDIVVMLPSLKTDSADSLYVLPSAPKEHPPADTLSTSLADTALDHVSERGLEHLSHGQYYRLFLGLLIGTVIECKI